MANYMKLPYDFFRRDPHIWLSVDALLLHFFGLMHCSKNATGGHIRDDVSNAWAYHFVRDGVDLEPIVSELVAAGLWEVSGQGWFILETDEYTETVEQMVRRRVRDRTRSVRRATRKASAVNVGRWRSSDADADRCYWCGVAVTQRTSHVDHVLPVSKGGGDWPDNLVISCAPCNLKKKDKHPLVWVAELCGDDK